MTDLSTNVDFSLVRDSLSAAGKLEVHGPTDQGNFLLNMGIQDRLQMLMEAAIRSDIKAGDELSNYKDTLEAAFRRLTYADQMGRLYKVMSVTAHDNPLKF